MNWAAAALTRAVSWLVPPYWALVTGWVRAVSRLVPSSRALAACWAALWAGPAVIVPPFPTYLWVGVPPVMHMTVPAGVPLSMRTVLLVDWVGVPPAGWARVSPTVWVRVPPVRRVRHVQLCSLVQVHLLAL